MKRFVLLVVLTAASSALASIVDIRPIQPGEPGSAENPLAPSDTLVIPVYTDTALLCMDACLELDGPATIVDALSKSTAAAYGWDPVFTFDPVVPGTAVSICGCNLDGAPGPIVGWYLIRCDDYGDVTATLREGDFGRSATVDGERPSVVGQIIIHQEPTVTLVPIEEGEPGSPSNPLRPWDEITIWVTSDGVLGVLEARLDVTSGPGTIVEAVKPSDCAQYGWEPSLSLEPVIEGNYGEIRLGSFVGAGPGLVGYFALRCDREGIVGVVLHEGWGIPPPEPPYYVYGGLEIYVESPPASYFVNADDGNDLNDGLSPETAFATIQKGIDEANDGNTVIVAPGTYTGAGNRDITFRGKAIAVRGTDPYDPNIVAGTIIDCNGSESTPHRGFKFHSGEGPNSVLSGLTITGGYGHEEDIGETLKRSAGGAILCKNASPTLTYCRIVGNKVGYKGRGAGICCLRGDLTVSHSTVSNNTGQFAGGGAYCAHGQQTFSNCIFAENRISWGAAIYCYTGSNAAIDHCTITGNTAGYDGGGICCGSGGRPTITNSIIWGNAANRYWPEITCGSASFCDIKGGYAGTGNIDADPCFADPSGGDYHLLENSACVNRGDPNYTADPCETDIDGDLRVINNRLDIGADEVSYIGPLIRIEPAEFVFEAAEGRSNPGTDVLVIKNAGTGTLYWEITQGCPWLDVYPTAGELTNDTAIVSLYVDISGLTVGSYNCELTVSSSNAANSPQTVAVTLYIYDAGPLHVPSEYPTIQDAIDWAFAGATVVVAPGSYTGAGNKNLDFGGKAITVRSTDPTDPCVVAATVIDCQGSGRGFRFHSGEDANSVVSGLTITRGNHKGGGVYCSGASPTIENCMIVGNDSQSHYEDAYGGGICCWSNSSPTIAGCTIKDNKAQGGHGIDFGCDGGYGYGGGIYCT
ncbi:MAG: right-handed parallel beta-helix repeat-containing protein, partial [Planctomycetota bacterium]